MTRILVPLAEGFEEIEAITPIDVWRRANYEVIVAGLNDGPITATRKTKHLPDTPLENVLEQDFDLIFLPGGRPGADHLADNQPLCEKLKYQASQGKWIAAICAAPLVLDKIGLLDGKTFTCHPAARSELRNKPQDTRIAIDGKIITAIAAGAALELALSVVGALSGPQKIPEIDQGLFCPPSLL